MISKPFVVLALGAATTCAAGWFSLEPANAALGGQAQANDNCTPMNTEQIGIQMPTPGTPHFTPIVDQHVILANGWRLVGWLTTSQAGVHVFVPYFGYFRPDLPPSSVPNSLPIGGSFVKSLDQTGLQAAYADFRKESILPAGERISSESPEILPPVLIAPCFSSPAKF